MRDRNAIYRSCHTASAPSLSPRSLVGHRTGRDLTCSVPGSRAPAQRVHLPAGHRSDRSQYRPCPALPDSTRRRDAAACRYQLTARRLDLKVRAAPIQGQRRRVGRSGEERSPATAAPLGAQGSDTAPGFHPTTATPGGGVMLTLTLHRPPSELREAPGYTSRDCAPGQDSIDPDRIPFCVLRVLCAGATDVFKTS